MNKPFIKLINRAGEMKHTTLIIQGQEFVYNDEIEDCLLYTSPSPRDTR